MMRDDLMLFVGRTNNFDWNNFERKLMKYLDCLDCIRTQSLPEYLYLWRHGSSGDWSGCVHGRFEPGFSFFLSLVCPGEQSFSEDFWVTWTSWIFHILCGLKAKQFKTLLLYENEYTNYDTIFESSTYKFNFKTSWRYIRYLVRFTGHRRSYESRRLDRWCFM